MHWLRYLQLYLCWKSAGWKDAINLTSVRFSPKVNVYIVHITAELLSVDNDYDNNDVADNYDNNSNGGNGGLVIIVVILVMMMNCLMAPASSTNRKYTSWYYWLMTFTYTGAQLIVKCTCTKGHKYTWTSCENLRDKEKGPPKVNIDLCSSILVSGSTYSSAEVSFSLVF